MEEKIIVSQIIDNNFVEYLISCNKKIISNPKPKDKPNGLHKETNIELLSDDGLRFTVFIREHLELIENFTVGLVYHPDDDSSLIIVRYNGDHGEHRNKIDNSILRGYHIHKLLKEALDIGLKGENTATETKKYTSVRDAMLCFFQDLNIINFTDYYPELLQTKLFN